MVILTAEALHATLGGRPVLRGVDAQFAPGMVHGVIGPNGAGKSSLVRSLTGLLRPDGGRVLIDGSDMAMLDRAAIARRIAYLPQGQTLHWPLTVERLVALGRLPHLGPLSRVGARDRAAVERAMARTDVLPLRARDATELSGGERARVLLARALAVEAPVLIADEPLAALDPGHQLDIMALLAELARDGALVIAVLHDLSMAARFCGGLTLMQQGRIVAGGHPDAVLTPEHLAQVYGVRAWIGEVAGTRSVVPLGAAETLP